MDATGAALVKAVEPYGLMPLFFLGAGIAAVAVLCAFVFPAWKDKMRSDADTERMKAEAQIKLERSSAMSASRSAPQSTARPPCSWRA